MNGLRERVSVWLATGLGIGLVSPAPGTVGGLWGLPLAWAIGQLSGGGQQIAAIVLLALISIAICNVAARALGGAKDPGSIVLDEIVGLPIVFVAAGPPTWATWLAGWALFRLFDIAKPSPVRTLERLPGGLGIVVDDLAAACYAWVALRGLLWLDSAWTLGWFTPTA